MLYCVSYAGKRTHGMGLKKKNDKIRDKREKRKYITSRSRANKKQKKSDPSGTDRGEERKERKKERK